MDSFKRLDERCKHLRMVHFTLVVTCLGLAAVAQSGRKTKVQRALEDISFAITLQSSYPSLWLDKQAKETVRDAHLSGLIGQEWGYSFKASGFTIANSLNNVIYIKVPSTPWTIWSKETLDALQGQSGVLRPTARRSLFDTTETNTYAGFVLRKPETIGEFRELWRFLGLIDQINILAPRLQNSDGSYRAKWMAEDENTGQYSSVDVSLSWPKRIGKIVALARPIANWDNRNNKPVGNFFHVSEEWVTVGSYMPSKLDPFNILIPTTSVPIDFYPQLLLSNEFSDHPRAGNFDDIFPELSTLTMDLSETSLHDLRRLLTNQESQSDPRVEVFGLSIPVDSLAIWGNVILSGMLVFLSLHLRKFTDEVSDVQDYQYPWIGLYQDKVSFAACLITGTLLPMSVSVLLFFNGVSVLGFVLLLTVFAGSMRVGDRFLGLRRHVCSR